MTIKPGKYVAKVVDYAFRVTQAGKPEPMIRFAWKDEFNTEYQWNWRGSLNEGKAREITLKALKTCGFVGDDLSVIADGLSSGALDTTKELQITVALKQGQDGKEYPEISWINEVGGSGFQETLNRGQVAALLRGMNLKAELASMKSPVANGVSEIPF